MIVNDKDDPIPTFIIGMISRRSASVKRMLMYAACKLADEAKRNWKASFSKMVIRNGRDTESGAGTSCDHLILYEPFIIPQFTGRLTHGRYCEAVLFTDHFSNSIFLI